ncbi:MAG: alpha-L-fucosidase [Candidatus Hydrogenedentales bacterium]|jgi:alpha-L-fucosidase
MWKSRLLLAGSLALAGAMRASVAAEPPAPCAPVPTPEQLAWQRDELSMFVHFTVNAFTDREWGDGTEDPKIFNPLKLDCEQWVRVAKETGFKLVILTTKHHDGFCLFPSDYTEHDIANAAWKDGRGDLVREFVEACRKYGLKVGFYLSPWDRHEPKYADNAAYDVHFRNQLTELLTRYGPVSELWFDGAGGEGHVYDWQSYYALIRRLQPKALIAICGPDIRWVGNEDGFAREDESSVQLRDGQEVWYPAECDVSIRPGWFWHQDQDDQVKSLEHLLDIYYRSVGRNSGLLLNVPPNDQGLFCEPDIQRLKEWRAALDQTFATDFAAGKSAVASNIRGGDDAFGPARALDGELDTYWATDDEVRAASLEVEFGAPATFNVSRVQEYIPLGERVRGYTIEAWQDGAWKEVVTGTTVGHKKLERFPDVTAQKVRLTITASRACPLIAGFGLHYAAR